MVNRKDLRQESVDAARSVMFELMGLLSPYRDHLVLVGGSVPPLLMPQATEFHMGTLDVDLALDAAVVEGPEMSQIETRLIQAGFRQSMDKPCLFTRVVERAGRKIEVQVDLVTGEKTVPAGEAVQVVHGCELAFVEPELVQVPGALPDGSILQASLRIASAPSFICMKALTFADRLEFKDAYDLYYCLKNHPGGIDPLAEKLRARLDDPLVGEAIGCLENYFSEPEGKGPKAVA